MVVNLLVFLKNLHLKNCLAIKVETYVETSSGSVNLIFFVNYDSWRQSGQQWGRGANILNYRNIQRKIFLNLLLKNQLANKALTCMAVSSGSIDSNCVNHDPLGRVGLQWGLEVGLNREKSSFQKPNRPQKLSLVWKHPQQCTFKFVQIMTLWGRVGRNVGVGGDFFIGI